LILTLLSLALTAGCAQHISVVPTKVDGFAAWSNEVPPHRLAAGDEFDIRFLLNPELNDTKLLIGPDGRVTVPLLGDVVAGGLTLPEFRQQLQTAYASKLRVADLDVVVRTFASSRIFVGGEVKSPGVLAMQGPTDALQGVLMAGGFLSTARSDEVVLIRRRADRVPMLRTLNLRRYAGSANAADDLPLQPADVIYVPKSGIAELDTFVDQYLTQALPFQKALTYTVGSGSSTLF
jgi:protein involved in polysaccharide export with SLBB domain